MRISFSRQLKYLVLAAVSLVILASPAQLRAQCWASFDFDGTDPGSVSDYVATIRFILGFGPAPANLYELDINGDCIVDQLDLERWDCYFIYGQACLPQLPIPTCCNPDTVRGACCIRIDSCAILNPQNCASGYYQGDGVPCGNAQTCPLICGDVNASGTVNISDVAGLVICIFSCGPGDWLIAGDANCSGPVTISDAVYLVRYIFAGGPAPCASCS